MVKNVSPTIAPWLLFLPQLPAKPDYARVKLWRRLQPLGVVGLRGGVYALPNTPEAREDLEWVGKEVEAAGGTAVVCEAVFLEGMSDAELQTKFCERATYAFQEIGERARAAFAESGSGSAAAASRLRRQLDAEQRRDHFGASHRGEAERAVAALEGSLRAAAQAPTPLRAAQESQRTPKPRGALWVTRAGVFVDRIASAWLIRRFIDPKATFKFVPGPRYAARANEIRFDMFQGEYTHRGDRCTFETLLESFALTSPALATIAEIVHDIDLKDERYQRPEADGVAQVLHGLVRAQPDDAKRLKAGAQIFDSLYAQFSAGNP